MKFSNFKGVKSLTLLLLSLITLSSIQQVEAAPQKLDLFKTLNDVKALVEGMTEPFKNSGKLLNFEETVMKDDISKNSTIFEEMLRRTIVGDTTDTTQYNIITEKWFTNTIYNVYLTAF